MLVWNVSEGVSVIANRLCNKKVLIVLDDVDGQEQLEALVGKHDWFGLGSRIIVTSRDIHLLRRHGVEDAKGLMMMKLWSFLVGGLSRNLILKKIMQICLEIL